MKGTKTYIKNRLLAVIFLAVMHLAGCVDQSQGSRTVSETQRIITTSVTICEILDILEVEEVIGVPASDTYDLPERYQAAEKIGAAMSPDMEIVTSLSPTLILSPKSLESTLGPQYEESGIASCFMDLESVTGMYESIKTLGTLIGQEEAASALYNQYQSFIEAYSQINENRDNPSVLILMGLPGSYVVATEHSYAGSLVEMAGGINVYAGESEDAFITANTEDMLLREPDIILLTSHAMPEQVSQMFEDEFANNDIWKHFKAVSDDQVYTLDHTLFGMSANMQYKDALNALEVLFYENED